NVASDRSALDIGRFFVSRAALTGVPIGRVTLPAGIDAEIFGGRRGGTSLSAEPELALEYGDRVAVIASRQALPTLRRHFGDSIKSTTHECDLYVGVCMSFGV